jgi:hypothetical protein
MFGWRTGTNMQSESESNDLWLIIVADNPAGA